MRREAEKGSIVLILVLILVVVLVVAGVIFWKRSKSLTGTATSEAVPTQKNQTIDASTSLTQDVNSLDDGSSSDSDINSLNSDLQNL